MSIQQVLRGMYTHVLLVMAIYMMMLSAVAQEECQSDSRWNCPCAGSARREHKRSHASQTVANTANRARMMTEQLLDKLVREHFRGSSHHVSELRYCVQNRHTNPQCLGRYLQQCNLDGLPHVERRLNPSEVQNLEFVARELFLEARDTITRLAMFVRHSKLEQDRRPISASFREAIRTVEENGIYDLLCSLQQAFNAYSITWTRGIQSDVTSECRYFEELARRDNRNYMVFYTLDNVLNNIVHKMRRLSQQSQ